MAGSRALSDSFWVEERYRRSVNVAADARREGVLAGYVVTGRVRETISRILAGLTREGLNRAWSVTGPYGTGKSAMGVFLCQLLSWPINADARRAWRELGEAEARLLDTAVGAGGFWMVPVTGGREPLGRALLSGLADALTALPGKHPELPEQATKLRSLVETARGTEVSAETAVSMVEETARLVREAFPTILGAVVVYDELGKGLEWEALHPQDGDVGLLQGLAEMAARTQEPIVAVVTVLHQAFGRYAETLSTRQRNDWETVQGRYQDIPFVQSSGELLSLIGQAIARRPDIGDLVGSINAQVRVAIELGIAPSELGTERAEEILAACAPLHPTVALALTKLVGSRLAQNERSLFAFLSSGEPYGFQEFLHSTKTDGSQECPHYRLDRLYDYVQEALGSGLFVHGHGKRWAEIEEALDRLPHDAPRIDAAMVKCIGLLGLLGDRQSLKASQDVLVYALADRRTSKEEILASIARLESRKIALLRKHESAYGLWQGSDIDLDECLERGLAQSRDLDTARILSDQQYLKPFVAKRHLHQTGTLRYFVPWVVDEKELESTAARPLEDADGAIVFVLPAAGTTLDEAQARVLAFAAQLTQPRRDQLLFAIPRTIRGIREALEELAAASWVRTNVAALEGDSVARRELAARELAARERLGRALASCFDISSSWASSLWIVRGRACAFSSPRELAAELSTICDTVCHAAPIVRNELVNRQKLSSAVAGARRNLVEAMLDHAAEQRLGLTGYPPEASIYLSVLQASGLHHQTGKAWALGLPQGPDETNLAPLWSCIDQFLSETEQRPRSITDLYAMLRVPPFGIREGLLPIYLIAALLAWRTEIALFEEGTFVPEYAIAELERLLRAPEHFAVQRFSMGESRARLLTGYVHLLMPETAPAEISLLYAVRLLVSFARRLPKYTQMTEQVSPAAQAVRRVLFTAREPQALLFRLLPDALNCVNLDDDVAVDGYLQQLRSVLLELQQAFPLCLDGAKNHLLTALKLPAELAPARDEIRQRAAIVQVNAFDARLRSFLVRLRDERLPDREWLESVAAVVANKPPHSWTDSDATAFRAGVTDLAKQLQRLEDVTLAQGSGGGRHVLRLGITDESGAEQRELLRISPERQPELERAAQRLAGTLETLGLDNDAQLAAVALLARSLMERGSPTTEDRHE